MITIWKTPIVATVEQVLKDLKLQLYGEDQCKELERTPFRRFVLATDNDDAGRKGASQIKRLLIPKGFRFINLKWHTSLKDINDLVKEYGDGWKDHLTGY